MKIMYWSDFNCPYSYIGLKRLSDVVDELDLEVEWELKSFELEPLLTNEVTSDMLTRHSVKFGLTTNEAEKEIDEINEIALNDGLKINYGSVQLTSSRNAHKLVKFCQKKYPELSQELVFKIYESNFKNNEIISDVNVLESITSSIGLNENIDDILQKDSYDIEVSMDIEDARFNGLNSVPFYVLVNDDEQLSIPGAFEKIDFKIAIEDLISGEIKYKTFI